VTAINILVTQGTFHYFLLSLEKIFRKYIELLEDKYKADDYAYILL